MSKCYVNVCGGIGNQLFQIAAGYAYSKKYEKELFINVTEWTASQGKQPNNYADNLLQNFEFHNGPLQNVHSIDEKEFNYNELPYYDGDVVLNGYFQSLKYFQDYKDEFVSKLVLPKINTIFITNKSVAFHIRMGDYSRFPTIFGNNEEYFRKLFREYKDHNINVFTDSPEYVNRFLNEGEFNIFSSNSELKDLTALAQHEILVCSNSSFSWWASLLGVPKKKVYVPSKWLHDRDCSDIYYDGMIKI
jgi:hypothetical protein